MKRKISIGFFCCLLILSSCSKYEDGPWISFRSEEKRLQGQWLLKYFTVDGIDSLQFYNDYYNNECLFDFHLYEGFPGYSIFEISWDDSIAGNHYSIGDKYVFHDEVVNIYAFVQNSSNQIYPLSFLVIPEIPGNNATINWPITKLKYRDLWFKIEANDKEYELHLENVKKY